MISLTTANLPFLHFFFGVGAESEKKLHGWIQLYVIRYTGILSKGTPSGPVWDIAFPLTWRACN
jgi:hypothetical protein